MSIQIEITRSTMVHDEGTKFYRLILLKGPGGEALIKRWGKIASLHSGGESKLEKHTTRLGGESEFTRIFRQKTGSRGYKETAHATVSDSAEVIYDSLRNEPGFDGIGKEVFSFLTAGSGNYEPSEMEMKAPKRAMPKAPEIDRSTDANWASW